MCTLLKNNNILNPVYFDLWEGSSLKYPRKEVTGYLPCTSLYWIIEASHNFRVSLQSLSPFAEYL